MTTRKPAATPAFLLCRKRFNNFKPVMPRLDRDIQYSAPSRLTTGVTAAYWIARSSRAMTALANVPSSLSNTS